MRNPFPSSLSDPSCGIWPALAISVVWAGSLVGASALSAAATEIGTETLDEAVAYFVSDVESLGVLAGRSDPRTIRSMRILALAAYTNNDLERARSVRRQLAAVLRERGDPDWRRSLPSRRTRSTPGQKETIETLESLSRLDEIRRNPECRMAVNLVLGEHLLLASDHSSARELLREAFEQGRRALTAKDPMVVRCAHLLALLDYQMIDRTPQRWNPYILPEEGGVTVFGDCPVTVEVAFDGEVLAREQKANGVGFVPIEGFVPSMDAEKYATITVTDLDGNQVVELVRIE